VRRVIHVLRESEEQRGRRLWWSRFRRVHQAGAKRSHRERRARQAPLSHRQEPSPIRLGGLSALTDAHWEKIRPLLPKYVAHTRQQVVNPRLIIEGILWVIGTSSSWREVPERFGPWSSVAERYSRWCREGKWTRILQVLQGQEVPISSSA
jgi:Putative transposase of IS4/5 family (DUF4096)